MSPNRGCCHQRVRKSVLTGACLPTWTLSRSEAGCAQPLAELVEADTEARAGGGVAIRLPVMATAHDHVGSGQAPHDVPAALLAHDVAQSARDGLKRLLRERETLRRHRASPEQVPDHVERDPPLGIAERLLLLTRQADVGDSAATDVCEHIVPAGRATHLGGAPRLTLRYC